MTRAMPQNADEYFRKAREFAAMASQTDDPLVARTYGKIATGYVRLARHATQINIDELFEMPSEHRKFANARR
jgi:hypothetical protein